MNKAPALNDERFRSKERRPNKRGDKEMRYIQRQVLDKLYIDYLKRACDHHEFESEKKDVIIAEQEDDIRILNERLKATHELLAEANLRYEKLEKEVKQAETWKLHERIQIAESEACEAKKANDLITKVLSFFLKKNAHYIQHFQSKLKLNIEETAILVKLRKQ
jgi:hypothetical protein